MNVNLRDFMSEAEREQMDALLMTANARRQYHEAHRCGEQHFMMGCPCGCGQDAEGQYGEDNGLPADMAKIFGDICEFCKKYGMCQDECGDEELPFPL